MSERRYYLWNIGCQMNQADARRIAEALDARGLAPSRTPEQADLMILNTCVVRQSAEDRLWAGWRLCNPWPVTRSGRAAGSVGCFVDDWSISACGILRGCLFRAVGPVGCAEFCGQVDRAWRTGVAHR